MKKPTKAEILAILDQHKADLDNYIKSIADMFVALHNSGAKPSNHSDYVLGRTSALDAVSDGAWFGSVFWSGQEKDVLLGFASVIAGNPRKALKAAGVKA